jgi:hypothetical protein
VTTTVINTPSVFPIRRLIVRVKMAKRLRKKGLSMPDPYVKALYNGTYQRSSTLKDTCDPKWEHDFELYAILFVRSFACFCFGFFLLLFLFLFLFCFGFVESSFFFFFFI